MSHAPRIRAALTSNLLTCRFRLEEPLLANGALLFRSAEEAAASPLAAGIFALGGVEAVKLSAREVSVTRESPEDWPALARRVAPLIERQLDSKEPAVRAGTPSNMPSPEDIRRRAEEVLERQINPAVAAHGGVISILDVRDATIYVKLGGGCQGCGMAMVTLKQGVEQAFREAIPELDDVLDTTDHAAGTNPYYSPGGGHGHGH